MEQPVSRRPSSKWRSGWATSASRRRGPKAQRPGCFGGCQCPSSASSIHKRKIEVITIDGSEGEGGGQIVRNACALSLVTGLPFRITNVRGGREKPGLMRQHVTAIEAACTIGGGECEGVAVGSREMLFRPGKVSAGEYHFAVGTAGSTNLVLQTVLMPLLLADGPSRVVLEGGTHNVFAPPFDFIDRVFLP